MSGGVDVANMYNRQAQYSASASKDWQTYEAFKSKPKEPTPAEISLSIPPSEATQHSDGYLANMQSFQFYNSKNIERERALHKQVKENLQKQGHITRAAVISEAYSTRSEKGRALLGS